jgi:hypothetical protein
MPWQKMAMKDVASCDKPRGAASRHYIRGFPNGETLYGKPVQLPDESIVGQERTQGSEPSQYLKEKKETSIPKVVASEIGTAQTFCILKATNSAPHGRMEKNLFSCASEKSRDRS